MTSLMFLRNWPFLSERILIMETSDWISWSNRFTANHTQCAGTQDIIKKLSSCDPCGRKRGLKTVAFLLRLSIFMGLWLSILVFN